MRHGSQGCVFAINPIGQGFQGGRFGGVAGNEGSRGELTTVFVVRKGRCAICYLVVRPAQSIRCRRSLHHARAAVTYELGLNTGHPSQEIGLLRVLVAALSKIGLLARVDLPQVGREQLFNVAGGTRFSVLLRLTLRDAPILRRVRCHGITANRGHGRG